MKASTVSEKLQCVKARAPPWALLPWAQGLAGACVQGSACVQLVLRSLLNVQSQRPRKAQRHPHRMRKDRENQRMSMRIELGLELLCFRHNSTGDSEYVWICE